MTDEDMIVNLRQLFDQMGRLSVQIINDAAQVPGAELYRRRSGRMARAYELVGYTPTPKQGLAMEDRSGGAKRSSVTLPEAERLTPA
jgi:hypothetical protein